MFLLGSDALKSMIQNEATRPLVFSPAYYQTKQTLLDIKNLKVTADTVHVYRYVMKPTLPVRRDSENSHYPRAGCVAGQDDRCRDCAGAQCAT